MEKGVEPGTKPLLAVLSGERRDPPPVWLMRQAGRYLPEYRRVRARVAGFLELCYTPELAVEVTLQPLRRFPLDAAILFSDILVVPHALGMEVRFLEGEGPKLDPLREPADLARLAPAALYPRLRPVYETVAALARELPPKVTLIGFSGAPWTLACYMLEGGGSKDWLTARRVALAEPEFFARLVAILTESVIAYLDAQIAHGAEAVQLFDSWAGVLPEGETRRWVIEPARRIAEALRRRHPRVPLIAFPRGIGPLYPEFVEAVRPAGIGLDTTLPCGWAAAELPAGIAVQGNLDPVTLLVGGARLDTAVAEILAAFRRRPHIFNLGHGILPQTPIAHVEALITHLHSRGR